MNLVGGGGTTTNLTSLVGYIRHTDLFDAQYGISGATVSISGVGNTTTDSAGFYEFDPIDPGSYTVCADAAGYDQACDTKAVTVDITNWKSILMTAAAGDDDDDDDSAGDDDDSTDEAGPAPSVGGDRLSARANPQVRQGCKSSTADGEPSWIALALLLLGAAPLLRRRR